MRDKIKDALVEEAAHDRAVAKAILLSGTYLYPLKVRATLRATTHMRTILSPHSQPYYN